MKSRLDIRLDLAHLLSNPVKGQSIVVTLTDYCDLLQNPSTRQRISVTEQGQITVEELPSKSRPSNVVKASFRKKVA